MVRSRLSMHEERIRWWRTDLGQDEIDALAAAVRDRRINQGPLCRELELRLAEVAGVAHAAVTTSGSVALALAMLASGVRAGDEVVVPAATFIAPAHAALLLGAKVRLADVHRDRPLIDPRAVEAAISERTRAVVVVHLGGRAADVAAVRAVAARVGAAVIEDCAQAFTSRGAAGTLGSLGDAAAFSLGITKLVTTGEGGFVAAHSEADYRRLVELRNHGTADISRNRFDAPGFNFRLTDLQAAVGLAQLEKLEQKRAGVARVYRFYEQALRDVPYLRMLDVRVSDGELPLWAEVLTRDRERVSSRLAERGIEAKAFHPSLADSPHVAATGEFPNARRFASLGLTLPSGPDQPESSLERVADALRGLASEIAPLEWPPA